MVAGVETPRPQALQDVELAIVRLVDHHGGGVTHRDEVKLTLYLKGADG